MAKIDIPEAKLIDINLLKTDGKNPNKMTPEQERSLDESIKKFGFIVPVITNKDLVISDGEHRWKRAMALGMKQVRVIRLPLDEVNRRILRQVLNKLRGQHDPLLDANEYKFFVENDCFEDLQKMIGETDQNLVKFLASMEKEGLNEDDLDIDQALKNSRYEVKPGDVWQLGDHKLMCGDATDSANVEAIIGVGGGASADGIH